MSFSGTVKKELCKNIDDARHCQIAEFAAIFSQCGKISRIGKGKCSLIIHTENLTVAKKSFMLLTSAFNADVKIRIRNHSIQSQVATYYLVVRDKNTVFTILKAIKLLNEEENRWGDFQEVPNRLVQNTCCKRAYLRGVFMTAGSVTDPEKAYHLEIAVTSERYAISICNLMQAFGFQGKVVLRKKYHVIYLKEGSMIVDFLNVIGAHMALMNFENVRILKEVRNSVNRQVNCETANINKTVTAATRQMEDIRYIEQHGGISKLSEGLREIAELRLDYPDSSLIELGQMLQKPLGKSGVNHRLRKISEIAENMREQQGK